jgi:hypothetical protein
MGRASATNFEQTQARASSQYFPACDIARKGKKDARQRARENSNNGRVFLIQARMKERSVRRKTRQMSDKSGIQIRH